MFRLDREISNWCAALTRRGQLSKAELDEIRDHLLTEIETLRQRGASEEEAFRAAVDKLGSVEDLSQEYSKNHRLARTISTIANLPYAARILGLYLLAVSGLMLFETISAYLRFRAGEFAPPSSLPLPAALIFVSAFGFLALAGIRLLRGRRLGAGALVWLIALLLLQVPIFGGLPDNSYEIAGGLQAVLRFGAVENHLAFNLGAQVHVNSDYDYRYFGINLIALLAALFAATLLFDRRRRVRGCAAAGPPGPEKDVGAV
jgi:hypothetical protein